MSGHISQVIHISHVQDLPGGCSGCKFCVFIPSDTKALADLRGLSNLPRKKYSMRRRHSTEDAAKRCKAQEMHIQSELGASSSAILQLPNLPKGLDARVCTAAAAAAAAAVSLASNLRALAIPIYIFNISQSNLLYRSTCTLINTAKCICTVRKRHDAAEKN